MPVAMALLRDVQNLCPREVLNFILDLIKYNDNAKNKVRLFLHPKNWVVVVPTRILAILICLQYVF